MIIFPSKIADDEDFQFAMQLISLLPDADDLKDKFGPSYLILKMNDHGPYLESVLPLK